MGIASSTVTRFLLSTAGGYMDFSLEGDKELLM